MNFDLRGLPARLSTHPFKRQLFDLGGHLEFILSKKFFILGDTHTHTVCVPYYKAAPYNISHTKIFSRAKYNRVI